MAFSTYFLASVLWSVAGFVIGFFAGKMGAKYQLEKHMESTEERQLPWHVRFLEKMTIQTATGVLILIFIAIGMTTVVQSNSILESTIECQTAYNKEYSRGLQIRSDAAARERNAQRQLLTTTLNPNASPQDKEESVRVYLRELDVADRQRSVAPLPILPPGCDTSQVAPLN